MKATLAIVLLLGGLALGCAGRVELTGRSPVVKLDLAPRRPPGQAPSRLPAHLVLEEKAFREPSGNRALDAGEAGSLYLKLRNTGLGPAKVAVRVTPLGPVEHLAFDRFREVGELPRQQSREVSIPLRAGLDVDDGEHELRVEVTDEYTRASLPFTVRFETRGVDPPVFRIVMRDYEDGDFFGGNRPDGRVAAGEMIKVTANVQNTGGDAEGVTATVESTADIQFYRDLEGNTDNRYLLEDLATGNHRDIEFYFYTLPLFDGASLNFTVKVTEARARWPAEEVLAFDIGQSVRTEDVLAVEAVQEQQRQELQLIGKAGIDIEQIPQGSRTRRDQGLAVIIGIEEYKHTFPATYKLRDATTFYQYSRDVLGIPEARIMLRTDEDATKAEFDYIFEPKASKNDGWLKKRLRDPKIAAGTDLFVYLGGHGFPDLASGRPYLIPHDVRPEQATNGVSLEKLYETLSAFGARSVTVFVESCFSGASGYDRSGAETLLAMHMNPVVPVMERPVIGPQMVVFTAASGDKPSNNREDLKHGIFTYFVLKGLGGQADANRDQAVNVEELYRYLERQVPAKALEAPLDREQVPEVWPSVDRLGARGRRVLVQF